MSRPREGTTAKKAAAAEPRIPPPALWFLGGTVAVAALFYGWLTFYGNEAEWGPRGDAIGPFVALLNAAALFGALWSIALQRRELAYQRRELQLQRREMRAQRREMALQRKEAEKAAAAQERLAKSQDELATAQRASNEIQQRLLDAQSEANRLTWFQELAQRRANLATFTSIVANAETAAVSTNNSELERVVKHKLLPLVTTTQRRVLEEQHRVEFLENHLRVNQANQ